MNEKWIVRQGIDNSIPNNGSTNHHGFVYVIEYGGGIKIGCTARPLDRMKALKRSAEKYGDVKTGKIAISEEHTNYRENEKVLHKAFSDKRIPQTERFQMDIDEFFRRLPNLEYRDDSAEKEEKAEAFLGFMKSFVMGGYNERLN